MNKQDPITPYPKMYAFPGRHFGWHEVACKCGKPKCPKYPPRAVLESKPFFLIAEIASSIRGVLGRPLVASSWYRCLHHPLERKKPRPGTHVHGIAVDLLMTRFESAEAVRMTLACVTRRHLNENRILGFGFNQRGPWEARYLHVDVGGMLPEFEGRRGTVWTY